MFANPGFELQRALVSADRNVSLAHMTDGIRATGIAEFAAPDAPPDMANARLVQRQAQALIPALKGEPASQWMGPRPSHPEFQAGDRPLAAPRATSSSPSATITSA